MFSLKNLNSITPEVKIDDSRLTLGKLETLTSLLIIVLAEL